VGKALCSVGLDVGTTTTQLVVSRLEIENRASGFAVPEMEISKREVIYESPVHFTPLVGENLVDGSGIRAIVEQEYRNAGISRTDVDTGAVIITGETSRKENARAVLSALSELAGDFVVATAGPDLESVLAAKGAGAVRFSRRTGKRVLHMDIGGGTSNLAWIEDGVITATGCLNVGGRLVKLDETGRVTYVSPVLDKLCKLTVGEKMTKQQARQVAQLLVQGLEMAAGLRPATALLDALWTKEAQSSAPSLRGLSMGDSENRPLTGGVPYLRGHTPSVTAVAVPAPSEREPRRLRRIDNAAVLSFSGGVADCVETERDWLEFGDLGPVLGQAIRESSLCRGEYRLGEQTIRATVIGAGSHSAQLSGSTVFCRNAALPLKNVPAVNLSLREQQLPPEELAACIRQRTAAVDGNGILALPGLAAPGYGEIARLAQGISQGLQGQPVWVAVEQDMAKALGQRLALQLPGDTPILCIDRVKLESGSFLDVGHPVGPALPVVVKTLVLAQ